MTTSLYMIQKVSEQAERTFPLELVPANYDAWYEHWFQTAQRMKQEFLAEGLEDTAVEIDNIVEEQRRFVYPWQEKQDANRET